MSTPTTIAVTVAPSKVVDRLAALEAEHAAVVRWLDARDERSLPGAWRCEELYDKIRRALKDLEMVAREVTGRE